MKSSSGWSRTILSIAVFRRIVMLWILDEDMQTLPVLEKVTVIILSSTAHALEAMHVHTIMMFRKLHLLEDGEAPLVVEAKRAGILAERDLRAAIAQERGPAKDHQKVRE